MAFAPRTAVKDFSKLSMFEHELHDFKHCAVLTLREGAAVAGAERVETRCPLSRGSPHKQVF
jgi:hypothetical protein